MKRLLLFLALFASHLSYGQATVVVGTLVPYANGTMVETRGGAPIGNAAINGQGFMSIAVTNTPSHTFTLTPVIGSVFSKFSVTVTVAVNQTTNISSQLIAAMPIPNPFPVPALAVLTDLVSIDGLQYYWPATLASGPLCNDGLGNLVWGGCGGSGSMTWPAAAGIANYAGADAWGTSYNSSNLIPANFISTLNQNTTGSAAGLSGTPALPNGTTATTQAVADNTTKIATDAFVLANAGGSYNPTDVAITGGAIDGTVVGGTTPAAGTFSQVTVANDGVHAGIAALFGNTTLPTLPANMFGWLGFNSPSATAYFFQPSTTAPAANQVMAVGAPSGNVVPVSYVSNATTVNGQTCTLGSTCTISSGGTVTSLTFSSPLTGGTITTSGTVACPTCGLTGSPLSQFASTTSAQLAGVLSDETGTGFSVFSISPALTGTPTVPTASLGTSTNQAASTAFVLANISNSAVTSVTNSDGTISSTPTTGAVVVSATVNPNTCTVNTAKNICLGVSPYVADGSGFWQTAINLAMNTLATNGLFGGNIWGCGSYPGGATPIDTSGGNAIYEAPTIPSVAGATNITITFNGCTAITPTGGNSNGMTLSTTNNTAGVSLFGAYSATSWTGHFTAVKMIFNHVNLTTTGVNTTILNCLWCNALETHDVLMLGPATFTSGTGGTGLITPSLANNFQIVIDRTGIFGMANGAVIHEHTQLDNFSVSDNFNGIQFDGQQNPSTNSIGGTNIWMQADVNYLLGPTSGTPATIQLSRVDIETDPATGFDCLDASNLLHGLILYSKESPNTALTKSGCTGVNTYNLATATFDQITASTEALNSSTEIVQSISSTNAGGAALTIGGTGTQVDTWGIFSLSNAVGNGHRFGLLDSTAGNWALMTYMPTSTSGYFETPQFMPFTWSPTIDVTATAPDTGISRCGIATLCIGNGGAASFAGTLKTTTGTFTTALTVAGNNVCQSTGTNCLTPAFSAITAGTNANALLIGTGGSLGVSGSGTINATTLLGNTWAAPGTIGGTTPAAGTFTNVTDSALTSGSTTCAGTAGILVNCATQPAISNAITSATGGTGISAVSCSTATCTNLRGTYTMTAGTVSTGTILTLVWPTTTTAYACQTIQNGGATSLGLGHSVATATGMAISIAVAAPVTGSITLDYECQP